MVDNIVEKWLKKLERLAPFYIVEPVKIDTKAKIVQGKRQEVEVRSYTVVWNDGNKTKCGVLEDYMMTRYGVATKTLIRDGNPMNNWNGSALTKDLSDIMIEVYNGNPPHINNYGVLNVRDLIGLQS